MTGDGTSDVIAKTELCLGTNCHESRFRNRSDPKYLTDPVYFDRCFKKKWKLNSQDVNAVIGTSIDESIFLPMSVPVMPDLNVMAGALESHVMCNESTGYLSSKVAEIPRKKKKSKRRERRERKIGHCFSNICNDDQTFQNSIVPEIAELNDIFDRIAEAVDPVSIQKLESCIPFEPEYFGSELHESSKRRKRAKHSRKEKIKAKHISSQPVIPISDDGSCIQIPTEASVLQSNDVGMQNCDAVQAVSRGVMELNINNPNPESVQLGLLEFSKLKRKSANCKLNKKTDKGIGDTVESGADISVNGAWTEDIVNQIGSGVLDTQLNEFTNHNGVVSLVSTVQNDSSILHDFNTMINDAAVPESYRKKRRDKKSRKERRKEKHRSPKTVSDESAVPPFSNIIPPEVIASATEGFNVNQTQTEAMLAQSLPRMPVSNDMLLMPGMDGLTNNSQMQSTLGINNSQLYNVKLVEDSSLRNPDPYQFTTELVDLPNNTQMVSPLHMGTQILNSPHQNLADKRKRKSWYNSPIPYSPAHETAVNNSSPAFSSNYTNFESPARMSTESLTTRHHALMLRRPGRIPQLSRMNMSVYSPEIANVNDVGYFPSEWRNDSFYNTNYDTSAFKRKARTSHFSKLNLPEVIDPANSHLELSEISTEVLINKLKRTLAKKKRKAMSEQTPEYRPDYVDNALLQLETNSEPITSLEMNTELFDFSYTIDPMQVNHSTLQNPELNDFVHLHAPLNFDNNIVTEPPINLNANCVYERQQNLSENSPEMTPHVMRADMMHLAPETFHPIDTAQNNYPVWVTNDPGSKFENTQRLERPSDITPVEISPPTADTSKSLENVHNEQPSKADTELLIAQKPTGLRKVGRPPKNTHAGDVSTFEAANSVSNAQKAACQTPSTAEPKSSNMVRRSFTMKKIGRTWQVTNQSAAMIEENDEVNDTQNNNSPEVNIEHSSTNSQSTSGNRAALDASKTKGMDTCDTATTVLSNNCVDNEQLIRSPLKRVSSSPRRSKKLNSPGDRFSELKEQNSNVNGCETENGADHQSMKSRSQRRTRKISSNDNSNMPGTKVDAIATEINEHILQKDTELSKTKDQSVSPQKISKISQVAKPCDIDIPLPLKQCVNLDNIRQEFTPEKSWSVSNGHQPVSLKSARTETVICASDIIASNIAENVSSLDHINGSQTIPAPNYVQKELPSKPMPVTLQWKDSLLNSANSPNTIDGHEPVNNVLQSLADITTEHLLQAKIPSEGFDTLHQSFPPRRNCNICCASKSVNNSSEICSCENAAQIYNIPCENNIEAVNTTQTYPSRESRPSPSSKTLASTAKPKDCSPVKVNIENKSPLKRNNELLRPEGKYISPNKIAKTAAVISKPTSEVDRVSNATQNECSPQTIPNVSNTSLESSVEESQPHTEGALTSSGIVETLSRHNLKDVNKENTEVESSKISASPDKKPENVSPASKTCTSANNYITIDKQNKSSVETSNEHPSSKRKSLTPKKIERTSHFMQNCNLDMYVYTSKVEKHVGRGQTSPRTEVLCVKRTISVPKNIERVSEVVKACDVEVPVNTLKPINPVGSAEINNVSKNACDAVSNKRHSSPRRLRNTDEFTETCVDNKPVPIAGESVNTVLTKPQTETNIISKMTRPSSALRRVRKKSQAMRTMLFNSTTETASNEQKTSEVLQNRSTRPQSSLRKIRKISKVSKTKSPRDKSEKSPKVSNEETSNSLEIGSDVLPSQARCPPSTMRAMRKSRTRKTEIPQEFSDNADAVNNNQKDIVTKLHPQPPGETLRTIMSSAGVPLKDLGEIGLSNASEITDGEIDKTNVPSKPITENLTKQSSLDETEKMVDAEKPDEQHVRLDQNTNQQQNSSKEINTKTSNTLLATPKTSEIIPKVASTPSCITGTVLINENVQTKPLSEGRSQTLNSKRRSSLRSVANTPHENDVRNHDLLIKKNSRHNSLSPNRIGTALDVSKRRKSEVIDSLSNVENEYPTMKTTRHNSYSPRRIRNKSEPLKVDAFKSPGKRSDTVSNGCRECPTSVNAQQQASSPNRIGRRTSEIANKDSSPSVTNTVSSNTRKKESHSKMNRRHHTSRPMRKISKSSATTMADEPIFAGRIGDILRKVNETTSRGKSNRPSRIKFGRTYDSRTTYALISTREVIQLIGNLQRQWCAKVNTKRTSGRRSVMAARPTDTNSLLTNGRKVNLSPSMSAMTPSTDFNSSISDVENSDSSSHEGNETPCKINGKRHSLSPRRSAKPSESDKEVKEFSNTMNGNASTDRQHTLVSNEPSESSPKTIARRRCSSPAKAADILKPTKIDCQTLNCRISSSFKNTKNYFTSLASNKPKLFSPRRSEEDAAAVHSKIYTPMFGPHELTNKNQVEYSSKPNGRYQCPSSRKRRASESNKAGDFVSTIDSGRSINCEIPMKMKKQCHSTSQNSKNKNLKMVDLSIPLFRCQPNNMKNSNTETYFSEQVKIKQYNDVDYSDNLTESDAYLDTSFEVADIKTEETPKLQSWCDTKSERGTDESSFPWMVNKDTIKVEKILESDDVEKMNSAMTSELKTSISAINPLDIPARPRRYKPNLKYLNSNFYVENCTFGQALRRTMIQNAHGLSIAAEESSTPSIQKSSAAAQRTSFRATNRNSQIHIPKNVDTLCTVKINRLSASALMAALEWQQKKNFRCPNCHQTYKRQEFLGY